MAVGVIIGGAFGKIVSSFVGDIVMPTLGMVIGGVNFTDLAVQLGTNAAGDPILLKWGMFLQTVLDFMIIAASIFMAIKGINKLKTPPPAAAAPARARRRRIAARDSRHLEAARLTHGAALLRAMSATQHRARQCAANASRVRLSGADVVHTTSSSMRMPPNGRQRSTSFQSMCWPRSSARAAASSMSMK